MADQDIPSFDMVAECATRISDGLKGESAQVARLALLFVVAQHIADAADREAALSAALGHLSWFANLACGGAADDHGAPVH